MITTVVFIVAVVASGEGNTTQPQLSNGTQPLPLESGFVVDGNTTSALLPLSFDTDSESSILTFIVNVSGFYFVMSAYTSTSKMLTRIDIGVRYSMSNKKNNIVTVYFVDLVFIRSMVSMF